LLDGRRSSSTATGLAQHGGNREGSHRKADRHTVKHLRRKMFQNGSEGASNLGMANGKTMKLIKQTAKAVESA
jgi:hypothetical protein